MSVAKEGLFFGKGHFHVSCLLPNFVSIFLSKKTTKMKSQKIYKCANIVLEYIYIYINKNSKCFGLSFKR